MKKLFLTLLTLYFGVQVQAQNKQVEIKGGQFYVTIDKSTIPSDNVQFEFYENESTQDTVILYTVDFGNPINDNGYPNIQGIVWVWDEHYEKWKTSSNQIYATSGNRPERYIPTWVMSLDKYTNGFKHTRATCFRAIRIE